MTVDLETEAGIGNVERLADLVRGGLTVYVNGQLLEFCGDKLGFLRRCDTQLHGYKHLHLGQKSVSTQASEIRMAKRVFQGFFGFAPLGWRSPYLSFTGDTLRLLHEAGFLWDSSYRRSMITWLRRIESPIYLVPIDSKLEIVRGTTLLHCYEIDDKMIEHVKSLPFNFQTHKQVYDLLKHRGIWNLNSVYQ